MKAGPLKDLGYLLFKGFQAIIDLKPFIFLQVIAYKIVEGYTKNTAMSNEYSQWIGIIVSLASSIFSLYLHFAKKARVILKVTYKPYDYTKGFDAFTSPVDDIVISFVNTSNHPLTIDEIRFIYNNDNEQTQLVYDYLSYDKRRALIGTTLLKSQSAQLSLSYRDDNDKSIIANLKEISLISTYGDKYSLNNKAIKKVIDNLRDQ